MENKEWQRVSPVCKFMQTTTLFLCHTIVPIDAPVKFGSLGGGFE